MFMRCTRHLLHTPHNYLHSYLAHFLKMVAAIRKMVWETAATFLVQ